MYKRITDRIASRAIALRSFGLLLGLALAAPAVWAIQAPVAGSANPSKAGLQVNAPEFDVQPSTQAAQGLNPISGSNPAVARFLSRYPGDWTMTWDRRNDRPNLIMGSGIPLIPGRGNGLSRSDVGLSGSGPIDFATVGVLLEEFISNTADLLKTDGLEFSADTRSVDPFGPDRNHWFVEYQQVKDGVPVIGAHLFFRIAAGNIVQFGTYMVAPVTIDTHPAASADGAFALAFAQMAFPPGTHVVDWLERGSLEIRPYMPDGAAMRGQPFRGALGSGYAHRLVWRFAFRVDGDRTTYQVLVDANTNQVIDVRDLNMYATATVDGGVYPSGARNIPGTTITVPFPYVNVSNGGTKTTDASGNYNYGSGTASTTLNGKYIKISDTCGNPSLSTTSPGDLHLGTSNGTDCTKPANSSSTHSARNAFYYLTDINRKAASYYPSNTWLNGTVTANVNINDVCNAYWDGSTLNFFKSGSYGATQCANTGELSGVFMHEFGHGVQAKIGGSPTDMGTGEATGDTFAFLQTHDGCIGDGFYANSPDTCTGVRDVAAYAVHGPGSFVVKPSNITASAGPDCDNGMACPYFTQGQAYQGPMGYEGHCESYIAGSANWDLAQELTAALGNAAGWQKMDDLWYAILPQNKAAYRVESGGKCNTSAVVNGCGSNNWYNLYLAADDDDGNLANGTPNACRIWDAFNAHGIACGTRPVCSASAPDFNLNLSPTSGNICTPGNVVYTVNTVALGNPPLTTPIDLSVTGLPTGASGNFSPTPVTPGSSSTLTLNATGGASAGSYTFTVTGNASGVGSHGVNGTLNISTGAPTAPLLSSPTDGASGVSLAATLSWGSSTGATSYTVQVATDAAFSNVINTQTGVTGTSASVTLQASTTYYWRVKPVGDCGDGPYSAVRSFTTGSAPFPAPYCNVTFPNGVEPITRVTFAGFDKTSSATVNGSPALEDFTATVGNVTLGESLSISVKGNTAGNYTNKIRVYVDWNQDGDFLDAGETTNLSDLTNSTGIDSKVSTGTIAVPAGAVTGQTRMRVLKKYFSTGDPCNSAGYGQAEDYTLNVAAAAASPEIDVSPSSLTASQAANSTTTQTLTIGNTGGSDLTWAIEEAAARPVGFAERASSLVTSAPAPFVRNWVLAPMAEVIQDGSFEAGDPNSYWDVYSQNFGTVLCDASCSQSGTSGARTGDWWAWFGGINQAETGHVYQDVTIAPGTATLSFWVQVPASSNLAADYLAVSIDSTELWRVTAAASGAYASAYQLVTLDVSAFADGGVHAVKFDSVVVGGGSNVSNFYVDDVSLDSQGGPVGGCSNPSDVPWLSVSPASGTTPASGSSNVTVGFDSTGLAAGDYDALLCITSNDPVTALVTLPVTMTVTGTPVSYPITVNVTPTAGGSASCTPNPVAHGGSSSCTATANTGYTFSGWSGDCTGASCDLTNVDGTRAVTATFTQITYPIAVTVTPAAGGSASCTPNPVAHGGSSSCTATTNPGYTFAGWSGDCAGASCDLTNVESAKTVTATFTQITYPITVNVTPTAGGNASCTPNPVAHGGSSTCTATANPGYTFSGWSGDCTGATCGLTNVDGARTVTATFTQITYPITVNVTPTAGGNASCTPNPVAHGGSSTCTATPVTGYTFAGWSGDCTGATCDLTNVESAKTVTATFTQITYPITVNVTPTAGGNASCTPNPVAHGGSSTCTATANPGYTFAGWTGDCTGATCGLTNVDGARTVTATFTQITYPITVNVTPTAGGNASCTPNPVAHGGSSTCTATPATGYTFTGWSGDCTGASCDLTNVKSAKTVTANFEQAVLTVTPSVGTGAGTISPATPQTVIYNGTLSFILEPDTDEVIGSVGGTCGGTLTGTTYMTSPITVDCTVVANFIDVAIFKDGLEEE